MLIMQTGTVGFTVKPAEANTVDQSLAWDNDSTFTEFHQNQFISISFGTFAIDTSAGGNSGLDCSHPGSIRDTRFVVATDVYIVPSGNITLGGNLAASTPIPRHTIVGVQQAGQGVFVDEIISNTGANSTILSLMSHNIGNNKYDVIYDECQDGFFDSGDAIFPQAFEVKLDPAQTPQDTVNFSNELHTIKDHAAKVAKFYRNIVRGSEALNWSLILAALGKFGPHAAALAKDCTKGIAGFFGGSGSVLACGKLLELISLKVPGLLLDKFVVKPALLKWEHEAAHWEAIAADPPDADYKHLTPLGSRQIIDPHNQDSLIVAQTQFGNEVTNEDSILSSFLSTLQRYQGATSANDIQWLLIHGSALRDDANMLVSQLNNTNEAINNLQDTLASDPRQLDVFPSTLALLQNDIKATGFPPDVIVEIRNLGLTDDQIDKFKTDFISENFTFNKESLLGNLTEIRSNNAALMPVLKGLSTEINNHIAAILANPVLSQFDNAPVANPGGPYKGVEGVPVTFDGTLSTSRTNITSYKWDLDGDGAFNDATGHVVSSTYHHGFNGIVGLNVTNSDGLSNIGYTFIKIADINSPPHFDSLSPADTFSNVTFGTPQAFSANASDNDGDPVSEKWFLEGNQVATGNTFIFTPTRNDLGPHSVVVNATDNSALGGFVVQEWILAVTKQRPTVSTALNTTTITLGQSVTDVANLTGGLNPTGTITYEVFTDNNCTAAVPGFTSTVAATGNNGLQPSSDPFTPTTPGTYFFKASYNGDANNTVESSDCQSEKLTVKSVNHPPVTNEQSVSTARNTPVPILLNGTDSDKDPLTLSITSDPAHGTLSTISSSIMPPQGMIGWWPGDANADDIINGNHGTLQNGATFAAGKVGKAFSLDGIDDYVSIPDNDLWTFGTNNFTTDLWVNFNSVKTSCTLPGGEIFVGQDTGAGPARKWFFGLGCGFLYFHINSRFGFAFLAPAPFSPNLHQWYHLALTKSGNTYTIFVDGQPVSSQTIDRALPIPNVNAPLTIGWAEGTGFVNGLIDEVEIYDRALSQSEIQDIFNAGIVGKAQPGLSRGLVTYTPSQDYIGPDSFTYKANDGLLDSIAATVSIDVTQKPNTAPVANDRTISDVINLPVPITLTGRDADGDPLTFSIVTPPAHGTLSGTAPNLTYTPESMFTGADSFTYKANDGKVDSNIATVSIAVKTNQTLPEDIIVGDRSAFGGNGGIIKVDPNTGLQTVVSSAGNFVDPVGVTVDNHGDIIVVDITSSGGSIVRVNSTTGAQTVISSGGNFSQPNAVAVDRNGDLIVCDGNWFNLGGTGKIIRVNATTGAQTVISSGGNLVSPRSLAIDSNGQIIVADANAFGLGGAIFRIDPLTGAQTTVSSGGLFAEPDGIAIDANGDFIVSDPFAGGSSIIRVNSTSGAQTLISSGGNLVDNFALVIDPQGKIFVADPTAFGGNGGIIKINPAGDGQVQGSAQMVISSGGNFVDPFYLAIGPAANKSPVANNQSILTVMNLTKSITLTGSVADGLPITFSIVSGPNSGKLSGSAPNLIYTPNANFNGTDSFTFKVNDGRVDSNIATVAITVTFSPITVQVGYADNLRPSPFFPIPWDGDPNVIFLGGRGQTFDAGAIRIINNGPTNVTIDHVTVDLPAPPGACGGGPLGCRPASFDIWTGPNVIQAGNSLILTQTSGQNSDTSDYGFKPCGTSAAFGEESFPRIFITINGITTEYDDSAHVIDTGAFDLACIGNESLQWRSISTTVLENPGGNLALVGFNDAYSTSEDTVLTVPAPGVLGNDIDEAGHPLTAVLVSGTTHGTLTLNSNGSFSYTPNTNYNGPDSFTYKANDGTADSNIATVSIAVNAVR